MVDSEDFDKAIETLSANTGEVSENRWRWEIWPHPYSSEFDSMVTNNDSESLDAIVHGAEMHLWDGNTGGERSLKVVFNADVPNSPPKCVTPAVTPSTPLILT